MNKHPADSILEYLHTVPSYAGTKEIAQSIGVTEAESYQLVLKMKQHKPEWFALSKGFGDSHVGVGINNTFLYQISQFEASGGYTSYFSTLEMEAEREQDKREMEITKLRLEIESLRIQPWVIWANILLSIIAIIISIFALKK